MKALHVTIVSDVICPWCYIGKRRFEKAVRALGGEVETTLSWQPFELNPQMPREGMDRKAYRIAKSAVGLSQRKWMRASWRSEPAKVLLSGSI